MIISRKHKLVYIRGKKVAGNAIGKALLLELSKCEEDNIITTQTTPRQFPNVDMFSEKLAEEGKVLIDKELNGHSTYIDITTRYPETKDYTFIALERCPYERVLSGIIMDIIRLPNKYPDKQFYDYNTIREAVDIAFSSPKNYIHKWLNAPIYKNNKGEIVVVIYNSLSSILDFLNKKLNCTLKLDRLNVDYHDFKGKELELYSITEISYITEYFKEDFLLQEK